MSPAHLTNGGGQIWTAGVDHARDLLIEFLKDHPARIKPLGVGATPRHPSLQPPSVPAKNPAAGALSHALR